VDVDRLTRLQAGGQDVDRILSADESRHMGREPQRHWLTVIDDLGQKERASDTLRDAWYNVINPRWLKRGWLICTSNWTPDELVERGTINAATYSRLVQMTHGKFLTFDGADQRLQVQE